MKPVSQHAFPRLFLCLCLLSPLLQSCGKSLYSVAANKETDDAIFQDAVLALNKDDFATASTKLGILYDKEKSLEVSQLFSISLLGEAGYNLFDVIKKALATVSDDSSKQNSAGNAILDKISSVVGTTVTNEQYALMKKAVLVLTEANDQSNAGLKFQKCLTAGIYAAPTLAGLATTLTQLNTKLQELPTKVSATGSGSSATCGASSATISEVGAELTSVISQAATLATRIQDVEAVMGECLPAGSADSVNEVTKKVTNLATKSDKGCSIPSNQTIGSFSLPTCMNSFVQASGGDTAKAGDNQIAGCEVFLNCAGGTSCFN